MSSQTVEIQEKQTKGLAWHVLKRYFEYSEGYRWMIVAALVLFTISSFITSMLIPYLIARVFDEYAVGNLHAWNYIGMIGLAYLASQGVMYRLFDYYIVRSQTAVMKILDGIAIRHILKNEAGFFKNTSSGATDEKARRLSEAYEGIYDVLVFGFLPAAILSIAATIVSVDVHVGFGVFVVAWGVAFATSSIVLTRRRADMYKKISSLRSRFRAVFGDIVRHGAFIDLAGTRQQEAALVDKSSGAVQAYQRKTLYHANVQWGIQGVMIGIVTTGFFALVPFLGVEASIGDLVLISTMIGLLTTSIWNLSNNYDNFVRNVFRAKEMFEIIDREPAVVPYKPGVEPRMGDVVFKNVGVRYDDDTGRKDVFDNFSTTIPRGQKFALVGPSGSGKTTFVQALMRAVDPHTGTITVGGVPSIDVERDLWRTLFAFVPQDPSLFDRSLREMIAYGVDNPSEADIIEAAKKAQAHEFISELPNGYDSIVGERGVKLSGGQRQRILIAQAFFQKKPILILDEATSSLDNRTERKIKEAIDNAEGMTVIAIAHRLSTVEDFDRICVLDEGKIVQCGTHDELLAQEGLYKRLYDFDDEDE